MTDTEILDYLQASCTLRGNYPHDAQIGSVTITLGVQSRSLREHLIAAIDRDKAATAARVANKLTTGR